MTDRPIIFSAPMVQALLYDRKTQTRRIIKPQPVTGFWLGIKAMSPTDERSRFRIVGEDYPDDERDDIFVRFAIGDRLWVRESCAGYELKYNGRDGIKYTADSIFLEIENTAEAAVRWLKLYTYRGEKGAKVPSIHMPRWVSRLTMVVTDVRVERLLDISDADKTAEGATIEVPFGTVWKKIHGQEGWDANPWVVAITFTVHKINIDQMDKQP